MIANATKVDEQADAPPAFAAWLPAVLSIAAVCAVFGFVFQREIVGAFRVWNDSTAYNHCFLVLPLVAMLLWMRRDVIALLRPAPAWWPLAFLPALSAVWALAALLDILEGEQLVAVALFEVLLAAILGWRMYRALMAPLLFLFFLVPFGAFLVPLLQRFTAAFIVHGVELLGIPVFAEGFTIQIPEGVFEVAEACAGLRFLIASIVFGCFFATIAYQSMLGRSVFIMLSIVVPVLANGARALGLVLLAHVTGDGTAALADHILYGWLFFTLVTFLLIGIGMPFATFAPRDAPRPTATAAPVAPARIAVTAIAGLLLALVGPIYLGTIGHASAAALVSGTAVAIRSYDSTWALDSTPESDWEPAAAGAERSAIATYRNGDASVTQFVALYLLPERGSLLLRTISSVTQPAPWHLVETGQAPIELTGSTITANTAKIAWDGRERVIWWFYMIDGRLTGSIAEAKLLQLRATLRSGTHLGALIAISTEAGGTDGLAAFLQTMLPAGIIPIARRGVQRS